MAVQNQTPVASFTTSGVTTVFPFAFMLLDADDLSVTLDGAVVSSGFSVSGIGAPAGGSVVFTTAPSAGQLLVLRRNIALQRLNDYQRNGDLLAQVLNLDLDRIWQALQGLRQDATRAIKLPDDTLTDQIIADDATARAGKVVGFDSSGNAVAVDVFAPDALLVSAFIETLLSAANAAAARTILGAVGTTGAETIAGTKTFSASPVIPNASASNHPVSKSQLDAETSARTAAIAAATLAPTLFVETAYLTLATKSSVSWEIPSWARNIRIAVLGASGGSTGVCAVRIGAGGSPETTGYVCVVTEHSGNTRSSSTVQCILATSSTSALQFDYLIHITKSHNNYWMIESHGMHPDAGGGSNSIVSIGHKECAGALNVVQLLITGDTWDAGVATLFYE